MSKVREIRDLVYHYADLWESAVSMDKQGYDGERKLMNYKERVVTMSKIKSIIRDLEMKDDE